MQTYMETFKNYLADSEKRKSVPDAAAMQDALYQMYSEENLIENALISERFQSVEDICEQLSFLDRDQLLSDVLLLCAAYEQAALIEGACAGAKLMQLFWDNRTDCV